MSAAKKNPTGVLRAAIYCRISQSEDELGVERQRKDCLALVERNGWTVVKDGKSDTFTDNDISGAKDATERAAFGRLGAAIRAGHVDAVVATNQARIYRHTTKFLEFCDECKDFGVEVMALVSDADINPNGSLFVATIIAAKDAEYRRNIGELIRRKHLELAMDGRPKGGPRCFGYEKDGITIVPREAKAIRWAVKYLLDGGTIYGVRKKWMADGIESVTNKRNVDGGVYWSTQATRRILTRPRIAGLRQHQGTILEGVETAWKPIVDRADWEALCAMLNDPSRKSKPPSREYPLRGMLTCAVCESSLASLPDGKSGRSYGCRKDSGGCGHVWVKADPVEQHVIGILRLMAASSEIQSLLESENEVHAEELRTLLKEKEAEQAKLQRIDNDYGDEKIPASTHASQMARVQKRIDAIESRLAAIRGSSAVGRLGPDLKTAWPKMNMEERQAVMKMLVHTVQVGKAVKRGGNKFDPRRVTFGWRSGTLGKVMERIDLTSIEDFGKDYRAQGLLTMNGKAVGVVWNPT